MRLALIGIDHGHARAYQETLLSLGDRVEVVGLWGPRREALVRATHPHLAGVPVYDTLDRLIEGARPQAVMSFLRNDEFRDRRSRPWPRPASTSGPRSRWRGAPPSWGPRARR